MKMQTLRYVIFVKIIVVTSCSETVIGRELLSRKSAILLQ
jgi:hypothetical protein